MSCRLPATAVPTAANSRCWCPAAPAAAHAPALSKPHPPTAVLILAGCQALLPVQVDHHGFRHVCALQRVCCQLLLTLAATGVLPAFLLCCGRRRDNPSVPRFQQWYVGSICSCNCHHCCCCCCCELHSQGQQPCQSAHAAGSQRATGT